MKFNKLFREHQGLIISIGILIASALGLILGVVPIVQTTMSMYTDLNTVSAEVAVLKNKVSVLESIDEISIKTQAQTLLSAVPSDKSLSTLLGTLDGLSAKTGVSQGTFLLSKLGSLATESARRLSADEQAIGGNIVPFSVVVSGSLDQIRGFLTSSISIRRLLRVRSFDISFPKTGTESGAMVSATLAMDTFYAPLPTTIGAVGNPLTPLTSADDELIAKVENLQLLIPPSSPLPPPAYGPAKADPFSL